MAIKKKITEQEFAALPDEFKDSYEKGEDGYVLKKVDGFVDSSRLDEFRNNNRTLQSQIAELEAKTASFTDEDIEELKALREKQKEMEEKDLIERGEFEQLFEQRKKPIIEGYEKKLSELQGKITSQETQLSNLLIRDKAQALGLRFGIAGDQEMGDLLRRVSSEFKVVDGKAVRVGSDGEPVYGENGNPVTLDDGYMESTKKTSPYLFRSAEGSNSDPNGGTRRHKDSANLSSTQKIAAGVQESGMA